jgi:hypothetical protein
VNGTSPIAVVAGDVLALVALGLTSIVGARSRGWAWAAARQPRVVRVRLDASRPTTLITTSAAPGSGARPGTTWP